MVLEVARHGELAAVQRGVAEAHHAVVGRDAQGDEVAGRTADQHLRRSDARDRRHASASDAGWDTAPAAAWAAPARLGGR